MGNIVVVEPSDGTLINLFPGDSGDKLYTTAWHGATDSRRGQKCIVPSQRTWPPFSWAQWLGGGVTGTIACGTLEPSCRLVALRLQDRLAITALHEQLDTLSRKPCPIKHPCRINHLQTAETPPG